MPYASSAAAVDSRYFLLDGTRNITGPTTIINNVPLLASDVLKLRGAAGQTGNMLLLEDSDSTDRFAFRTAGRMIITTDLPPIIGAQTYGDYRAITLSTNPASSTPSDYFSSNGVRTDITQPSGSTIRAIHGIYTNIELNGRYNQNYGHFVQTLSYTASAAVDMSSQNLNTYHYGAGLLARLAGIQNYTYNEGPTTAHYGYLSTVGNAAASGNVYGFHLTTTNTGVVSGTVYGAQINATQSSGSTVNLVGLDVVLSGAGSSTTHGIRTNGNLIFAGTQKIIGGTSTTADLTLQTTTGVGASGADMHFLVGNAGATEALTILNSGKIGIGFTSPSASLAIGNDSGYNGGLSVAAVSGRIAFFGGFEITAGTGPSYVGQGIRCDGANRKIQFVLSPSITLDDEAFEIDEVNGSSLFSTPTSGTKTLVRVGQNANFQPTSGNATLAFLKVVGGVQQSGSASGITRGVWINSNLYSAVDWRSLEITPNGGYAVYQSGASAKNYFNGNVGIKTLVPNNALDVTGTVQADGLRLDLTPTAEVIVPTHTITISVNGTNYKIPLVLA
jgi:hypothetical protein